MIRIENLTKFYASSLGNQYIFKDLSFDIPTTKNLAILGGNGAGKSTLFRLLAGSEYPNSGKISSKLSLSWPVALSTGIHPKMSGRENARFIGRINGVDELKRYERNVENFAELKQKFDLPVSTYSSGMRSRLAFGCSVCIDFDVYLIDEITAVGDSTFRQKAKEKLKERSKSACVIMVSHRMDEIRQFCESAIVLNKGKLELYSELEEGIDAYRLL
jgi:capsular polysaccharide transport system ATP-binding protein